jgi:hypothetical protein
MSDPISNALDGVWKLVRAEMGGDVAPELFTAKTELKLAKGNYVVRFSGDITDQGTFETCEETSGKVMILKSIAGTNSGRTILCRYQLTSNQLMIRYGLDGIVPDAADIPGINQYFAVYVRSQ